MVFSRTGSRSRRQVSLSRGNGAGAAVPHSSRTAAAGSPQGIEGTGKSGIIVPDGIQGTGE